MLKAKLNFLIICLLLMFPAVVYADTTTGLVGWWRFEEASGNASDSSGNGNTGTPTGTTIVANCIRGNCRDFNGTSDRVNVANSTTLDTSVTRKLTVAGWIKLDSFYTGSCNANYLAGKGININATDGVYQLLVVNVNACAPAGATNYASFSINIAGTRYEITGGTNLIAGVWHHLTGVYTGSTIRVYVNGVSDATPVATAGTLGNTTDGFTIGYFNYPGFEYWVNGLIDDVRVYNRDLTAQDIYMLYLSDNKIRNASMQNVQFK